MVRKKLAPFLLQFFVSGIIAYTPPDLSGIDFNCGISLNSEKSSRTVEVGLSRVIGGQVAPAEKIPWQVLLGPSLEDSPCGGSIISPNYILTAGHCNVDIDTWKVLIIRNGEEEPEQLQNLQTLEISEYIQHPEHNYKILQADLALIKTSESIQFNNLVQPICLNRKLNRFASEVKFINFGASELLVSGYGNLDDNLPNESRVLNYVGAHPANFNFCENKFKTQVRELPDGVTCAGNSVAGQDVCRDDGGGPAAYYDADADSWLLWGVISFHNGCGRSGYPAGYTDVAYFQEWIDDIVFWPMVGGEPTTVAPSPILQDGQIKVAGQNLCLTLAAIQNPQKQKSGVKILTRVVATECDSESELQNFQFIRETKQIQVISDNYNLCLDKPVSDRISLDLKTVKCIDKIKGDPKKLATQQFSVKANGLIQHRYSHQYVSVFATNPNAHQVKLVPKINQNFIDDRYNICLLKTGNLTKNFNLKFVDCNNANGQNKIFKYDLNRKQLKLVTSLEKSTCISGRSKINSKSGKLKFQEKTCGKKRAPRNSKFSWKENQLCHDKSGTCFCILDDDVVLLPENYQIFE